MILYSGKAKHYSFKWLLYNAYLNPANSRPLELLESVDFGKN